MIEAIGLFGGAWRVTVVKDRVGSRVSTCGVFGGRAAVKYIMLYVTPIQPSDSHVLMTVSDTNHLCPG